MERLFFRVYQCEVGFVDSVLQELLRDSPSSVMV